MKDLTDALIATGATLAFDAIGGWLLSPFLQRIGPKAVHKLQTRIATYAKQATGEKYLINPNKGLA